MHWLHGIWARATAYISSPSNTRMAVIAVCGILALFIAWLIWWIWWRLPKRQMARFPFIVSSKDRGDLENSFRQTITQTIGGLAVLFGASFAFLQLGEQHNDFVQQQDSARESLVTTQLSKGFEDLGSEQIMVRIGGVYALEAVMDTSYEYHRSVLEVLCAFVRQNTKGTTGVKPAIDVQAVLTVISRRWSGGDDIGEVDLSGTQLSSGDLSGDLMPNGTDLRFANLSGANLSDADLSDDNLDGANLNGAHLRNADLSDDNLKGADLGDADLRGAHLNSVDLRDANVNQRQLDQACGNVARLPPGMTIKPCVGDVPDRARPLYLVPLNPFPGSVP